MYSKQAPLPLSDAKRNFLQKRFSGAHTPFSESGKQKSTDAGGRFGALLVEPAGSFFAGLADEAIHGERIIVFFRSITCFEMSN